MILSSLMEFMNVTRVSAAPGIYVSKTRAAIRAPWGEDREGGEGANGQSNGSMENV